MYVLNASSCMYYFISHARDLLMLTVCTLWGCPQSACSQLSVCLSGLLYVLCPNKLVPAPTVMKQWEFVVCQSLLHQVICQVIPMSTWEHQYTIPPNDRH